MGRRPLDTALTGSELRELTRDTLGKRGGDITIAWVLVASLEVSGHNQHRIDWSPTGLQRVGFNEDRIPDARKHFDALAAPTRRRG